MTQKTATRKDLIDIGSNCAALRTRMAARGVTRAYDNALRPLGIKITQFTLLVSAKYDGSRSIGDMADFLAMERSTLTRICIFKVKTRPAGFDQPVTCRAGTR